MRDALVPIRLAARLVGAAQAIELERRDLVDERLAAFLGLQPIGGVKLLQSQPSYVWQSAIRATIGSAFGLDFVKGELALPAADVELEPREVPVLGTVTPIIHQVSTDAD